MSAKPVLWEATAVPAPPPTKLAGDTEAQVLIVGAGYSGLAAALQLAELGVDCAVVDSGPVGGGASGRNAGWSMGTWIFRHPDDVVEQYGERWGGSLCRLMAGSPRLVEDLITRLDLRCDYRRTGSLELASREPSLALAVDRAAQWARWGARTRVLGQVEVRERVDTPTYVGGVMYEDHALLNPLGYARELARAAIAAGARVYEHEPASALRISSGRWSVRCPGGTVSADRVLVAVNAFRPGLCPEVDRAHYRMRIAMVASRPTDLERQITPGGVPFVDVDAADLFGASFDPHGRLVMSILPALRDGAPNRAIARPFWRKLRQVFPGLPRNLDWEYAWHGDLCLTADRLFRVFEPAPGLLALFGYGGNGITQGTAIGRDVALRLAGRDEADLCVPVSKPGRVRWQRPRELWLNRIAMPIGREFLYR